MNVATHEAAHAVVGLLLGEELVEVTIVPNGAVLGRALFADLPDEYQPDFERRLRGSAIASLAGPCANPEGCTDDYAAAVSAALRLGGSEESSSRLIEEWTAEAERMLNENAGKVIAVRGALERRGTLTGLEVRAILAANP